MHRIAQSRPLASSARARSAPPVRDAVDDDTVEPEVLDTTGGGALSDAERRFVEWCASPFAEIRAPKLEVRYNEHGRRGVFARSTVCKGEFIAALPARAAFSRATLLGNGVGGSVSSATLALTASLYADAQLGAHDWADDVQYLELALLLLLEYAAGERSPWHAWLRALPHTIGNAATLPLHEIEQALRGNPDASLLPLAEERAASKVIAATIERVATYQQFLAHLCDTHPVVRRILDTVATQHGHSDAQARALFLWCVSIVDSRSFRGRLVATAEGAASASKSSNPHDDDASITVAQIGTDARTLFLAPFFDMVNHASGGDANASIYFFAPPPLADVDATHTDSVAATAPLRRYLHALSEAGVDLRAYGIGADSEGAASVSAAPRPLEVYRVLRAERDMAAGDEVFIEYDAAPEAPESDTDASTDASVDWQFRADMLFGFGFVPRAGEGMDAESAAAARELESMGVGAKYMRAAGALLDLQQQQQQQHASSSSRRASSALPLVRTESFDADADEDDANPQFIGGAPLRRVPLSPSSLSTSSSSSSAAAAAAHQQHHTLTQSERLLSPQRRRQVRIAAALGANVAFTSAQDRRQRALADAMEAQRREMTAGPTAVGGSDGRGRVQATPAPRHPAPKQARTDERGSGTGGRGRRL